MEKQKKESGMLIIEATVVFPVMFLVIFIMLFLGNLLYQKSKIDAIVNNLALDGAAYCANPLLYTIEETGAIPESGKVEIAPYRYFLGGMDDIEAEIKNEMEHKIEKMSTGLFAGMKPKGYNTGGLQVEFKNRFIASSFAVDLKYKIELPIRMLGQREKIALNLRAHAEAPVNDTTEFMRNVNMVEDYMEKTGAVSEIKKVMDKVDELFH